jgi:SRSO17 transposase
MADDIGRCRAAHVPGHVGFATKPRLAERMIERILPDLPEGGVWVAADEVYGRDGAFRAFLEEHRLPYAVTVQANQAVLPRPGWRHVARLVERGRPRGGLGRAAGGPSQLDGRMWQWWVRAVPDPDIEIGQGVWARWVIARRWPDKPAERDYYLAWGPADTPVEDLARVPGARWRVEEAIKLAKSACGLADYEVRSWHGWYRHITLSQVAAAFLAVQGARTVREQDATCSARLPEDITDPAAHTGGSGRSHKHCCAPAVHRL